MYPISKPQLGIDELISVIRPRRNAVKRFEDAFATKIGAEYAISFPYARSGLFSVLKSLGISNSEIIIPAYTCIVVPNAIVFSGNKPVFVDVSTKDFNATIQEIKKKITQRTKAIIATHMYGYPTDVKKLRRVIPKNILIIEDSCLSILTKTGNEVIGSKRAGSNINFFSFNPSKQMTTIYGGIVTTNNLEYYKKIKKFRDTYFKSCRKLRIKRLMFFLLNYLLYVKPVYSFMQYLYRTLPSIRSKIKWEKWTIKKIDMPSDSKLKFTDVQAEIGLIQLSKIEKFLQKRGELAAVYDKRLKGLSEIQLPPLMEGATYSHYTIRYAKRDKLAEALKVRGINVGSAFDYSIPDTPAYQQYKNSNCPNSKRIAQTIINLPFYPALSEKDIAKICKEIRRAVKNIEKK